MAARKRNSFRRLCVAQMSFHSEVTLDTPRRRNLRMPRASLICPRLVRPWIFEERSEPFLLGWTGSLSCGLLLRCEVHWEAAALQVVVDWSQVKPELQSPSTTDPAGWPCPNSPHLR